MTGENTPWGRQLVFELPRWHPQTFDTFYAEENELAVAALKNLHNCPLVYIWGQAGVGKTHCLQAVYNAQTAQGLQGVYLNMAAPQAEQQISAMLETLPDFLCLDNVQAVAGRSEREHTVFVLLNRMLEAKRPLVVAGQPLPKTTGFVLKDLESRLCWGPEFYLQGLSEEAKKRLVQDSARRRGVKFPDESLDFLLKRTRRDLKTLMQTLDRLDTASLAAQRPLSIPFLKEVLNL